MPARKKKRKQKKLRVSPWAAIGAAGALLLILFLIARLQHPGQNPETGAKVPPGSWRYGIDISHNNGGRIVWDSLYVMTDARRRTVRNPYSAQDIKPVSFVFIKATEGASFVDPDFKDNWRNAGRGTLRRGAYHFFRSSTNPLEQARNFIEAVGELRSSDLSPVLDIETIHKGCSREELCSKAMVWLEAVGSHYGRTPMIYTSDSFARDILSDKIKADYPLWIARYNTVPPKTVGWKLWQFTDRAVVHGLKGEADLSVMK